MEIHVLLGRCLCIFRTFPRSHIFSGSAFHPPSYSGSALLKKYVLMMQWAGYAICVVQVSPTLWSPPQRLTNSTATAAQSWTGHRCITTSSSTTTAFSWPIHGNLDITLMLVLVGGLRQDFNKPIPKLYQNVDNTSAHLGRWEPKLSKSNMGVRFAAPRGCFYWFGFSSTRWCLSFAEALP